MLDLMTQQGVCVCVCVCVLGDPPAPREQLANQWAALDTVGQSNANKGALSGWQGIGLITL